MVKIHKLKDYTIKSDDLFFFDANIWMYMFCSVGNYYQNVISDYSDFYQRIKESGNPILTSTLLISEFINSYSRLEFNRIKDSEGLNNYKRDFRSKEKYKYIFENINMITKQKIMKNSIKINDSFNDFDEVKLFDVSNVRDFNDEYYAYLAEQQNFKIVTHDRDFGSSNFDIEIITKLNIK